MGKEKKTMGSLKRIFIVHGWAYTTLKWKPFVLTLKSLGFDPILLKVPGLTSPINRSWNLDDYVAWLDTKIRDKKVVLLGHSNGGRISLAYVAKYPHKISHLFLIDSAGVPHRNLRAQIKKSLFQSIAYIGKRIYYSEKFKNILYTLAQASDYKNASPVLKQVMLNLIKSDSLERISEVKVPTTIIWGERDQTTPLKDGQIMSKIIKNSNLNIIKGAHHSPQFTHFKEVAQIVAEDLEKI